MCACVCEWICGSALVSLPLPLSPVVSCQLPCPAMCCAVIPQLSNARQARSGGVLTTSTSFGFTLRPTETMVDQALPYHIIYKNIRAAF